MIFDAENMFCDKRKAVESAAFYSDIIENAGGGDAYNPVFLFATVTGGDASGKLTTELQTADDEAFTTPIVVATFTKVPIKTKLPHGIKRFMRLKLTSTYTKGTITAALTRDIDL